MKIEEIMTTDVVCCEPSTPLKEVAKMMVDCDCGGIPVCEKEKLIGFITDRDIVCRVLADGKNPLDYKAQDAMTKGAHTVKADTDMHRALEMMKQFKVRRLPVVDDQDQVIGIVSQADLVRRVAAREPEVLEEVEETVALISEPKVAM